MGISRLLRRMRTSRYIRLVFISVCTVTIGIYFLLDHRHVDIEITAMPLPTQPTVATETRHHPEPRDVQQRMKARYAHLAVYCKHIGFSTAGPHGNTCKFDPVRTNTYYIPSRNLVVNIVPASSDVVIKRVLQMLAVGDNTGLKNPFRLQNIDMSGYLLKSKLKTVHELIKDGGKTVITFVKDPYARLLSFYMDNMFMPNAWAWRMLAKNIRPRDIRSCIHNVTFPEFVDYFANSKRRNNCSNEIILTNAHISDPCEMQYNYVGKYETLEEDLTYILKDTLLASHVNMPNFKTDSEILILTQYVNSLFVHLPDVSVDCDFSHEMAARRLWRRLQGKGLIGRYQPFPRAELDPGVMTHSSLQTLMVKSYLHGDSFDRPDNPRLALTEAYSSVSDATISELQRIFHHDFLLYQYSVYPDYIKAGRNKTHRARFLNLQ